MRKYPYVVLDVFSNEPLRGNQLAVFTQTRGLTDDEMQRLAKEMNYAESTFIIQQDPFVERERGIRVRIFTVQEELPFAGHPTLGTAAYLSTLSSFPIERIELALNSGRIPVTFEARAGEPAFGEMRQADPEFLRIHEREAVARATGLDTADISDDMPIQTVSTGLPFAIVPVQKLAALERLHENFSWGTALKYLRTTDAKFFYFLCTETNDASVRARARMIFYSGEDAATGSAAGDAAAWMAKYKIAASGERVRIVQGLEMQRRSDIYVRADVEGDKIVNVRVGGQSVIVARGEFQLP
jgi:trans-2,3-dihydro-3-hydroxyanthranilate isomerase